ncbi:uncharacterized protein METZ01_LOCUS464216, partial [marine metagenome]
IFSDWPLHREDMLTWHRIRNTVDRREKFRYFVEEVLGESENTQKIDALPKRFSVLTRQTIIHCPWVAGAPEFLETFREKLPLYLISATPQQELEEITIQRGIKQVFKAIFGTPLDKVSVLLKILESEQIFPHEMLYIGDSPEDLQAAQNLGVEFIGIDSSRGLKHQNLFTDFHQILEFLNVQFCQPFDGIMRQRIIQ